MATSLNALSLIIGMNTDEVTAGVGSIRQQMGRANRIMQMAKTDTERLTEGTKALSVAYHKGSINQMQLARGLKFLDEKYRKTSESSKQTVTQLTSQLPVVGHLTTRINTMGGSVSAGITAFKGMGAGSAIAVGALAGVSVGAYAAVKAAQAATAAVRTLTAELQQLDVTIKSAKALGTLVADLQSLQFALGESAGLDPGATENALRQLQRRVGETVAGVGEAKLAFDKLGLSASQLASLTPTQQFNAAADAIASMKNRSEQAYVASKLFGEELGSKLLPALTATAGGLAESRREADRLGLTLSQFQAAQTEQAVDSLGRLTGQLQGFKVQASQAFAPTLSSFQRVFRGLVPTGAALGVIMSQWSKPLAASTGLITDMANGFFGIGQALTGDVSDGLNRIKGSLGLQQTKQMVQNFDMAAIEALRTSKATTDAATAAGDLADQVAAASSGYSSMHQSIMQQITLLREGEAAAERMKMQHQGFTEAQINSIEQQTRVLDHLKAEEERRKRIAAAADDALKSERKRLDELVAAGQRVRESVQTPFETARNEIARLMGLLRSGVIDDATFERAKAKAMEGSRRDAPPAIAAIEKGSQEAYARMTGNMADRREAQLKKMEEQRLIAAAQLKAQQEANRLARNMTTVARIR